MDTRRQRPPGPPSIRLLARSFLEALLLAGLAAMVGIVVNWARGGPPLVRRAPFDLLTDCPEVKDIPKVSVSALPAEGSGVVFVDSRKAWEFCAGHVPGAFFLPVYETEPPDERVVARLKAMRGRWIVVYGDREVMGAARLATALSNHGVRGLHLLDGGLAAWKQAGRPVESCRIGETSWAEVQKGRIRLVDARPEETCRRSRVAGAVCLPFDDVLPPDPKVLSKLLSEHRPLVVFDSGRAVEIEGGGTVRPAWAVACELKARGASAVEVVQGGPPGSQEVEAR